MVTFRREDDWPDGDPEERVSLGDHLRARGMAAWTKGHPRRLLADGQAFLARRRFQFSPDYEPLNLPPEPGKGSVDSLDMFESDSWGWVGFPEGVSIRKLSGFDGERLTLELEFGGPARQALGLREAVLQLAPSLLLQTRTNFTKKKQRYDAMAQLLASAGAATAPVEAQARKATAKQTRAGADRDRRQKQKQDALWRRLSPVPAPWSKLLDQALGPLADLRPELRQVGLPAVAFAERRGRAPVGASKVGGCPDLPPGVGWPAIRGERLSFIAQINLAELPAAVRGKLPAEGLASLFMGQNESTRRVEHRLLTLPTRGLRRANVPDGPWRDDETGLLDEVRLSPRPMVSLPHYGTLPFHALTARLGGRDFLDDYFALQRRLAPHGDHTRAGGWSADDDERNRQPRILLSVGSHRAAELSFWDAGELEVELDARGRSRAFIVTS